MSLLAVTVGADPSAAMTRFLPLTRLTRAVIPAGCAPLWKFRCMLNRAWLTVTWRRA